MGFLLIEHASELVTPVGRSARGGRDMGELCIIQDGAVLCRDDEIIAVGTTAEVEAAFATLTPDISVIRHTTPGEDYAHAELKPDAPDVERVDARGKTVLPGYVDPHTHFIFGGYRQDEFQMRLQGSTYMEIMEAGGGIAATNNATHQATEEQLYEAGLLRLNRMLGLGITTVEGKTGYGEDTETENKMLTAMERLDRDHPVDIVRTYMGAHSVPPAFKGRTGAYVDYLIAEGLPMAKGRADFCDVFTEKGVFELEESERLLLAARAQGFKLKMHADEIVPLGGAGLAAKLRATSADHLLKASDEDLIAMRDAGVVATLLPCTAFSLREPYARGRFMIDNGLAVALGTDLNPGSCYTQSIPLMTALATIYMQMTIEETITALTLNAAAALDRADIVGSLEPGKKADIIVLDCPNHRHLSYHFAMNLVETVIKSGKVVRKR